MQIYVILNTLNIFSLIFTWRKVTEFLRTFDQYYQKLNHRNSRWQMFFKIGVLKNFIIFAEKHKCFLGNIAKFLRTACAAPFVEHLQNQKKSIVNQQKKKIKLYFNIWFLFATQGVKFLICL